MPDAAPASHAGNSCTDKITHPFYRLNLLPIPSYHSPHKGARPLCYFLGEKVTQKHFHTSAPLGRRYESAFVRSRGGSPELTGRYVFPLLPANLFTYPITRNTFPLCHSAILDRNFFLHNLQYHHSIIFVYPILLRC